MVLSRHTPCPHAEQIGAIFRLLTFFGGMLIFKRNKILTLFFLNFFAVARSANILVFGGNGFIGAECVKCLLEDKHRITVLNRGGNYWDYATQIKPFVNEIYCDRNSGLSQCSFFNPEDLETFDFVIDFSAFKANVIEDALNHLKGKIGTYIYISSDSVYEVSKVSKNKCSKEDDAVRPDDLNERNELNRNDRYGHHKLAGEEILQEKFDSLKVPYVNFRLADVLGPRDRSNRWWTYQAWMELYSSSGKPLPIPRSAASLKTSYVYVKDVAQMISKIVKDIYNGNNVSHLESFNIAFPGEYSLKTLLDSMQEALGVKGIEYRYESKAYHLLPSVTRGPVNISKATKMLQWMATPWEQAIKETVEFFKDAMYRFPSERHSMLKDLAYLVSEDLDNVQHKVKQHFEIQDLGSTEAPKVEFKIDDEL